MGLACPTPKDHSKRVAAGSGARRPRAARVMPSQERATQRRAHQMCPGQRFVGIVRALALILAAAIAPGAAGSSPANSVWLNEKGTAAIRLEAREGELSGRIVWMRQPRDESGRLKRDRHNPDPALRERPLCGLPLLKGFRRDGEHWVGGRVYNPRNGKQYTARLSLPEPDTLVMRGYVVLPVFGSSVTWQRADEPPGKCPHAADWSASGSGG